VQTHQDREQLPIATSCTAREGPKIEELVGTARFELATPCTPCKCATRLRHVPTDEMSRKAREEDRIIQRCRDRPPPGSASRDAGKWSHRGHKDRYDLQRTYRRRILRISSSSPLIWRTICCACVRSSRASSPWSRLRAPPIVKPCS
jgi:hypothetical protein